MTVETVSPPDRILPSGRSVVLRVAGSAEELEIRSPSGEVEVHILLTEAGPVVRLHGARLELQATDTVSIRGRRLEVETDEVQIKTTGDIDLVGEVIRLNS